MHCQYTLKYCKCVCSNISRQHCHTWSDNGIQSQFISHKQHLGIFFWLEAGSRKDASILSQIIGSASSIYYLMHIVSVPVCSESLNALHEVNSIDPSAMLAFDRIKLVFIMFFVHRPSSRPKVNHQPLFDGSIRFHQSSKQCFRICRHDNGNISSYSPGIVCNIVGCIKNSQQMHKSFPPSQSVPLSTFKDEKSQAVFSLCAGSLQNDEAMLCFNIFIISEG